MTKPKEKKAEERHAFKANCEVVLGEAELKECGKGLAEALNRKTQVEAEITAFKAQKNAEIATLEASIQRNTVLISTGREFRMVECEWDYLWKEGIKKGRRLDTGEVILKETISDAERQAHLPGVVVPPSDPAVKS